MLKKYDESMQYFLSTKQDINKRQALLRMVENEFKDYNKAKKYIEPYHKLWNLIAKFMDQTTDWKQSIIFSLNEEVINK